MAPTPQVDEKTRADVLGGLCFSCVETTNPMAVLRAAQWFNLAAPLQQGVPFFVIHDVGLALCYGLSRQVVIRQQQALMDRARERGVVRRSAADDEAHVAWMRLLMSLCKSTLATRLGTGGLSDNVMGALIARVLEPVGALRSLSSRKGELPLQPTFWQEVSPANALTMEAAVLHQDALRKLAERGPQMLLAAEQVDLDTLKLMQMMGGVDASGDPSAVLDLYRVLESPQAHDIVNFCLDLVPQVLETHRSKGSQTFAVGGYASIETKGNLDSLLPSELAYDDALFEQRWSENELLYFGREKDSRERERVHYILVDASAAMRGIRTTFARGLALALCKKLTLRGDAVWLRFFDSRLHERMDITARALKLPHILCFRSERGRNPARVFEELDLEVGRVTREEGKDVVMTIITHGRLSIPDAVMERLSQKAQVFGVVVLPSQAMDVPFARFLKQVHVVGADVLEDPQARTSAALGVLRGS